MQLVTVSLLGSIQAHTLDVSTTLIRYLSNFLDNTLKNEKVQGN